MTMTMNFDGFLAEFHRNEDKALNYLSNLVAHPGPSDDEAETKKKEETIMKVGAELAKNHKVEAMKRMIEITRPYVVSLGKAKAAKIIRNLVDLFLDITPTKPSPELAQIKVDLTLDCVEWAKSQNRVFLRQTLQARLVRLFNDIQRHQDALKLATALVKELKKLEDKDLIVEVQLEESKACYHLSNLSKARAALTSARTTANSIYIPPKMQAALDMQSGILHAADEKDFKTAFSYFYEAFEGYDSVDNKPEALRSLKYMLLSKIMLNLPEDVSSLLSGKLALKYQAPGLDAMKAVAEASKKRSLADFTAAFGRDWREELSRDAVVKSHFDCLRESMLEKNLCRIIQPYSRVQIAHIATKIGMDNNQVEKKLSQMILDGKISGILDQGQHVLVLLDETDRDETYEAALQTIKATDKVIDSLHSMANRLS